MVLFFLEFTGMKAAYSVRIEHTTTERLSYAPDGKSDWWYIHRGRKIGPHPKLVEEFFFTTGQQFHIYELLQFLRYAGETGSGIQADAVQQIEDTVRADSEAASAMSPTDRLRVLKVLRVELRDKESELDGLIKSLIDLPPKMAEEETTPRDDAKRSLKSRISELTDQVSALRAQLSALEASADAGAAGF